MKLETLYNVLSGFLSANKINENFQRITEAFNNTVSRDGSSPNSMLADLDMNSHKLLNLGSPTQNSDAASKEYVDTALENFSGGTAATGPQGPTGATGPAGATGATGPAGGQGADGTDGWSPVLAVVTDSLRRVLQVVDWQGGEGTKPAIGLYVGATGLTAVLASAVDIRGPTGTAGAGSGDMIGSNNLSDVVSPSTARVNLGLGTASLLASSAVVQVANALSDVNPVTARTNLGLGTAAVLPTATWLQVANNLSDINNAATARTNLGLGTAATQPSTNFANVSHTHPVADITGLGAGVNALLAAGSNITLSYNAGTGVTTIASTGGGVSTPASTWSTTDKTAGTTLSGSDFTATLPGGAYNGVRSTQYYYTGKKYFEVLVPTATNNPIRIGFSAPGIALSSAMSSSCILFMGDTVSPGALFVNASAAYTGGPVLTNGDRVCFAIDFDAGKVWVRINNGTWNFTGTGNPTTGVDGASFVPGLWHVAFQSFYSQACTINFGAAAFTYTIPGGYVSWT